MFLRRSPWFRRRPRFDAAAASVRRRQTVRAGADDRYSHSLPARGRHCDARLHLGALDDLTFATLMREPSEPDIKSLYDSVRGGP